MEFLGKALKNVATLGSKTLRTGAQLGQKAVDGARRGIDIVERTPVVGDLAALTPGFGTAKKVVDLAQRGVNVANQGAGVLESRTPSEALARSMNLGRTAIGARQRYRETGGGSKFLKGELER